MWLALTLATAARAGCGLDLLHDAVGATEIAFSRADGPGFAEAIASVRADLACADEPIGPADAAALHRVEALAAFLDRDLDSVVAHFAAARRLEPDWQLPASLALEDNPLRRAFDQAREVPPPERVRAAAIDGRRRQVDGIPTDLVPVMAPFVLQEFDAKGAVVSSAMMPAGPYVNQPAPMPEPPAPTASPVPAEPLLVRTHPERVPALIGGALLAVGAGLAGAESLHQRALFWDPRTDPTELHARLAGTNAWGIASASLGVGLVGTLLVAAF